MRRTKSERKAFPTHTLRRGESADDPRYERIRAACAEGSVVQLDLHATRVYERVKRLGPYERQEVRVSLMREAL